MSESASPLKSRLKMPDDNNSGSAGYVERDALRFRPKEEIGVLSAVSNHE
jgi:hypothetical protein